jgi:hypothetical protein
MGRRAYANLKYKLIKGMRNRALTFRERAKTTEEEAAWGTVIRWLNSFLKPEYRVFTKNGAIGLPIGPDKIEDLLRIPDEHEDVDLAVLPMRPQ